MYKKKKFYKKYEDDVWGFLSLDKKLRSRWIKWNLIKTFKAKRKIRFSRYRVKRRWFKKRTPWVVRTQWTYNFTLTVETRIKVKRYRYSYNSMLKSQKLGYFYGFFNRTKIKSLYLFNRYNKFKYTNSVFFLLESRLIVILYRLNLFNSVFSLKQFIKNEGVYINNKLIKDYNYNTNLFDIVSLYNNFNKLKWKYKFLKKNLRKKNFLQNYPLYIESRYDIMSFIMFRFPLKKEIRFPFRANIGALVSNLK